MRGSTLTTDNEKRAEGLVGVRRNRERALEMRKGPEVLRKGGKAR